MLFDPFGLYFEQSLLPNIVRYEKYGFSPWGKWSGANRNLVRTL